MKTKQLVEIAISPRQQARLVEVRRSVQKLPKLGTYRSLGLSSKMWIKPDGNVVKVPNIHSEWIKKHDPALPAKLPPVVGVKDDDTLIRLWALSRGYVRVNYNINGGELILEASAKHWGRNQKDGYFMIVAENTDRIDSIRVSLLDSKGIVIKYDSEVLFRFDDSEKLNYLPMFESRRGEAIRKLIA